ncbi:hypothetical protein VSWAT3_18393, partial [Vibrionales bacterium SWAT-3]
VAEFKMLNKIRLESMIISYSKQ